MPQIRPPSPASPGPSDITSEDSFRQESSHAPSSIPRQEHASGLMSRSGGVSPTPRRVQFSSQATVRTYSEPPPLHPPEPEFLQEIRNAITNPPGPSPLDLAIRLEQGNVELLSIASGLNRSAAVASAVAGRPAPPAGATEERLTKAQGRLEKLLGERQEREEREEAIQSQNAQVGQFIDSELERLARMEAEQRRRANRGPAVSQGRPDPSQPSRADVTRATLRGGTNLRGAGRRIPDQAPRRRQETGANLGQRSTFLAVQQSAQAREGVNRSGPGGPVERLAPNPGSAPSGTPRGAAPQSQRDLMPSPTNPRQGGVPSLTQAVHRSTAMRPPQFPPPSAIGVPRVVMGPHGPIATPSAGVHPEYFGPRPPSGNAGAAQSQSRSLQPSLGGHPASRDSEAQRASIAIQQRYREAVDDLSEYLAEIPDLGGVTNAERLQTVGVIASILDCELQWNASRERILLAPAERRQLEADRAKLQMLGIARHLPDRLRQPVMAVITECLNGLDRTNEIEAPADFALRPKF